MPLSLQCRIQTIRKIFIKNKDQQFLQDIPVKHEAILCRSKGRTEKPIPVSVGQICFGSKAEVLSVNDTRMVLTKVQGAVPAKAKATVTFDSHAYTIAPMSDAFHRYWAQFWLRDSVHDQESDEPWSDLFQRLDDIIPTQDTLDLKYDCPHRLWESIHKLKPYKAIGEDGWHSEELQALTWDMVVDLSHILSLTWSHGHTSQHMQARTLLFAK